ncbi:Conserved_hypothetical protein [Hexamita inflata]|uniref:Transmembrane protein n=1 Tax=Hexamita inflata TaxID=28002 RepID=A0AA86UGC9_9EUKA|nr:Conserved hypothetical protein [Hexamita inflata]
MLIYINSALALALIDKKTQIDTKLQNLLHILDQNKASEFIQTIAQDFGSSEFIKTSKNVLNIIKNINQSHALFQKAIQDQNMSKICTNYVQVDTTLSASYNSSKVNTDNYSPMLQVTDKCSSADINTIFKQTEHIVNLNAKSTIQYYELSTLNTLTYPYISQKLNSTSPNKIFLNFYGNAIKFIYPCKSDVLMNEPLDFNFQFNNEQQINYNKTKQIVESDLSLFVKELSEYKSKSASCYGYTYQTLGEKLQWANNIDNLVLDFIYNTYDENSKTVSILELLQAINVTINQVQHNEKLRLFKQNKPIGQEVNSSSKLQVFIKNQEFSESFDDAIQKMKQFKDINHVQLNKLNIELVFFGQQNKNSVSQLFKRIIFNTAVSNLDVKQYINDQMSKVPLSNSYDVIANALDVFDQRCLQFCNVINIENQVVGIVCTSVPMQNLFPSCLESLIVDTSKEILLASSIDKYFSYKYFLSQIEPQHYIHINQYQRSKIQLGIKTYYIENIDKFLRLILIVKPDDRNQYQLVQDLQITPQPIIFQECVQSYQNTVVLKQFKYKVDCAKQQEIVDTVKNDQQANHELSFILQDVSIQQLQAAKAYLGSGVVVGRMTKNNHSSFISDFALYESCWNQIQSAIYSYQNEDDYTLSKFHLGEILCFYEENSVIIQNNFTLLIYLHSNYLATDFILSKDIFDLSNLFNILSPDLASLNPLADNDLNSLFESGALLCKLFDKEFGMVKKPVFSSIAATEQFMHLNQLNGIVFGVGGSSKTSFNCSNQVFNSEIMKNSQERADYFINAFQTDKTAVQIVDRSKQYLIVIIVCLIAIFVFSGIKYV